MFVKALAETNSYTFPYYNRQGKHTPETSFEVNNLVVSGVGFLFPMQGKVFKSQFLFTLQIWLK